MKNQIFITHLLASIVFISTDAFAQTAESRPNIIVIMGDDHGQWALGIYGLEQIETPSLDYMADQGILFSNAMSPAPVCSPARASFYTGKMPSQHGVHDSLTDDKEYDASRADKAISNYSACFRRTG